MLEFWNSFKKKKISYFICYTAMFALVAAVVLGRFVMYRKTIIWYQDGLKQHYNAILYYGKYLRQIAGTLIREHRFELPMWDFTIGYGSDIITTFHYYAIGDPLALLVGLVPERLCQYFYCLLYVFRLYLAGLSFSAFSFWHGNKRFPTLVGSFIYVFSAYSLVLGLMHPFFVAPLVWFPLILLGIDKIFEGKSPVLFIVFTSIAAMSNFYFFYMEIALAFMYALFRYFCINRGFKIKTFALTIGKFAIYGLNSFLISAVILLPILRVMMTSARFEASEKTSVRILYYWDYYLKFIAGFTNMLNPGSWTLMGYTAVGLIAVIFGAIRFKKYRREMIVFGILTLFAVIPFGGFALNGFAYVVNRWIWAYAMTVGFIVSRVIDDMKSAENGEKRKIAISLIVGAAAYFMCVSARSEQTMASACVLMLISAVLLVVDIDKIDLRVYRAAIVGVLVFGLAINAYYKQSVKYDDGEWLNEFLNINEADKKLKEENSDMLLSDSSDFYRTEEAGLDTTQNSSIQRGSYGTQFYHSITNPNISEFINKLYLNWPKDYDYEGVESRSILEALASVKYFFVGNGAEAELPFNYRNEVTEGDTPMGNIKLYAADKALPLGYTYSKYVPLSDFNEMDVVTRADAMLNGAVVDNSIFEKAEISSNAVNALEAVESKGGIEVSDGQFYVRRNATVTLKIDAAENAETYVIFKGLKYKGLKASDTYDSGEWANLTEYQKNNVKAEDIYDHPGNTSSMLVTAGDVSKIVEVYAPGADFYCGRSDFLVNIGYYETAPKEVTISFRKPGIYTYESLEVVSRPVEGIKEGIEALGEDTLTDVEIGLNNVTGRISLDEKKILALSIPYSDGWHAFVDGQRAEIKRCNIMYMALELEEGNHHIELRYETPMLRTGAWLTMFGVLMLAVIVAVRIFTRLFFDSKKVMG